MLQKKKLLGLEITDTTEKEVLEYVLQKLEETKKKFYIVTPNPEILVYANGHENFKKVLNGAEISLADGIGIIWAGKMLGKPFKQKVTGADLLENLCKEISEKPITVGFLGAGPKIAEKTAECLLAKYPKLKVVYTAKEWGRDGFVLASKKILRDKDTEIPSKNEKKSPNILISQYPSIDILFVAFGFPKQEEWMAKNLNAIPVRVAIGVGGAFDYISGNVKRAPKWVQKLGFEWLYRLIRQPWRIKRQLALIKFIYHVLKEKLASKGQALRS